MPWGYLQIISLAQSDTDQGLEWNYLVLSLFWMGSSTEYSPKS